MAIFQTLGDTGDDAGIGSRHQLGQQGGGIGGAAIEVGEDAAATARLLIRQYADRFGALECLEQGSDATRVGGHQARTHALTAIADDRVEAFELGRLVHGGEREVAGEPEI